MRSIPSNAIPYKFLSSSKKLKTMRLAKFIGEDNTACYSRKIGCVIVDEQNFMVSAGRNGPPISTPHTDSYKYIKEYLFPLLKDEEKRVLWEKYCESKPKWSTENCLAERMSGCQACPRKTLGYKSGERMDLCSCVHAEINSITTARRSVKDCFLFSYSPVSCLECSKIIIQSGIKEVHFLDQIYQESSLVLYKFANIPIFLYSEDELNDN